MWELGGFCLQHLGRAGSTGGTGGGGTPTHPPPSPPASLGEAGARGEGKEELCKVVFMCGISCVRWSWGRAT